MSEGTIDAVKIRDRVFRMLDKLFLYTNDVRDITLMVYKSHDFPLLMKLCDSFRDAMKDKDYHLHIWKIDNLQKYNGRSAIVMFTPLLNDTNINDVRYVFNDTTNLIHTNKSFEVFQVMVECRYTNYHQMIETVSECITTYIEQKYANRAKKDAAISISQ